MPEQRYEAQRYTVGALLSTTSPRIEVPEWQRSYSWDSSQIEAFWQDLLDFDRQYPESNIEGEEYFLGSIVIVTGGSANLLLDGQQRLATATILLSALRDARRFHKADAATRLQSKYISDFDDSSNSTRHVLTMNLYDRDFFRAEIQEENKGPKPKPGLKSHSLIRKARGYFDQRIQECNERLGGGEEAFRWNLRLSKVLCDHMSVVAVTSTDEDNAASVFETLNDRGIGLSTPDLLRNFLLRRAADEAAREQIVAAWQQVLTANEDTSVDEFLRHYWVSHNGDVKSRKLYRVIKESVIEKDTDPLAMSRDLAESAAVYCDIVRARDDDPDIRRKLEAIRELNAKVLYPLLLSAYSVLGGEQRMQQLDGIIQVLLTSFMRHNVIGNRDSSVLETTVYESARVLRESGDVNSIIEAFVAMSPGDEDFVSDFKKARISRIATVRYVLKEIEHAMRQTRELLVEGTDRVQVEHIYPQNPATARWVNHSSMINRIGNLTLLSRRMNASIKNSDFPTKVEKAYKGSDILMTSALSEIEVWDDEAIKVRQDGLSRYISQVWSFPGSGTSSAGTTHSKPVAAGSLVNASPAEVYQDTLPEVPEDL